MSFGLALEVSNIIAENQRRQRAIAGLGRTLAIRPRQGGPHQIGMSLQQRRSERIGALGMSDSALGFGLVGAGAVVVVALVLVGLWFEYIRFRDGTKWERIMQGAGFLVRTLEIGYAMFPPINPKVFGAIQMLGAGLDAYAAGHQIARQEHYIANGLALLGDAWGLFDGTRLILGLGGSLATVPTNAGDGDVSNPNADDLGGQA
jgi:hypothetical protein